jgi:Fe-S cluster assembly protein SufB
MAVTNPLGIDLDQYKYGFHDPEQYAFKSRKGLNREIVEMISHMKSEPDWMRAFRLHSLGVWDKKPLPTWGGNVGEIDFNDIYYYVRPMENQGKTWDDVPENIKKTFDRLGIPRRRRSTWPAWAPQYDEVVYNSLRERSERSWAWSSWIWTPRCASIRTSSRNTSGRSSRPRTTSSRP